MFNWFFSSDLLEFVTYFWAFSILAMLIGWWLMKRIDKSMLFPISTLDQLDVYEISALRDRRKAVIHTALFNLWNEKLIEVSGKDQDAEIKITSSNNLAPNNTFEETLYNFIKEQPRNPNDFFEQAPFHTQFDKTLQPVYRKLEELHLRRDHQTYKRTKKIGNRIFWLITAIGLIRLFWGDAPIPNERVLLFCAVVIPFAVGILGLSPYPRVPFLSRLGERYLNQWKKYIKNVHRNPVGNLNPALRVAVLGVSGLAGLAIFAKFEEAFAASISSGSSVGIDSGDGGCGGGCGGCGGGGD